MSLRKGVLVVLLVLGIGIFGYSQYAAASQIGISMVQSELSGEDEEGSEYSIELRLENPSVLLLTSGKTEFFVIADEQMAGKGQLEPFTLQPLGSTNARGTFYTDSDDRDAQSVKITGVTKYDVVFTSIEIPFVYYPTEEQTREFIRQD